MTDRASWKNHYKPRLDPTTKGRLPKDWDERVEHCAIPIATELLVLPGGSLYGWIRNWMGVENVSYLLYDDPTLFDEMVTTVADCIIGTMERVLQSGIQFDACGMWEDIAYRAGPLIARATSKISGAPLPPHYRPAPQIWGQHHLARL